jgi:hypothetical protein
VDFVLGGYGEVVARMVPLAAAGSGWVNLRPVIEPEHQPEPPGPLAIFGGSPHKVPTATWVPGRPLEDGSPGPSSVGLQHSTGPRVARRLAEVGLPLPEGWKVTQDHPRRGLVAKVPAGPPDTAMVDWLARAATVVCAVPVTGRWAADVHAGRA